MSDEWEVKTSGEVLGDWEIVSSQSALEKRVKKLEDQIGWLLDRYASMGDNPKIEKMEIQINCLRKQVLDIEGKKSYTEQAREYADMRSTEDG